jgi:hypothetical protein
MRSVDFRTRTGADVRPVDAGEFFDDELPDRWAASGPLALDGARQLGVDPFGFEVDGRAWTVRLDADGAGRLVVEPGLEDARAVVRLDADGFHDLVNDLRTPMGFLTGGDLDMPRGRLEHFLDWWVVLRAALDGRRAHVAGDVSFVDPDGAPLDLGRSFRLDDDAEKISHANSRDGDLQQLAIDLRDNSKKVWALSPPLVPFAHQAGVTVGGYTDDQRKQLVRQVEEARRGLVLADQIVNRSIQITRRIVFS